jgi:hypothetical protein
MANKKKQQARKEQLKEVELKKPIEGDVPLNDQKEGKPSEELVEKPPDAPAIPEVEMIEVRVEIDEVTGKELGEIENNINTLQGHFRTRLALYRRMNHFPDFPKVIQGKPPIPDPVRLEFDQEKERYILIWSKPKHDKSQKPASQLPREGKKK